MTGLPTAMLNKNQSACFPESKKVSRWSFAVNYTVLPQWDRVNCSAVTHSFVKHQLADSPWTRWGGSEGYSTYPLLTGRLSSECPRNKQRRRGGRRGEGSWIYLWGAALSCLDSLLGSVLTHLSKTTTTTRRMVSLTTCPKPQGQGLKKCGQMLFALRCQKTTMLFAPRIV